MPIGKQEWENASKSSTPLKIAREFLEDEYPEAYTPAEIVEESESLSNLSQQNPVVNQLISSMNVLSTIGILEMKNISNSGETKTYYRAVKD